MLKNQKWFEGEHGAAEGVEELVLKQHKLIVRPGRSVPRRRSRGLVAGDEELPVAVRGDGGAPAEVAAGGLHLVDLLLRVEPGVDERLPGLVGRPLAVGGRPGVRADSLRENGRVRIVASARIGFWTPSSSSLAQ